MIDSKLQEVVLKFIDEMGYNENPNVLGIFLYGSSITGYATEISDVDIHVITKNTAILYRGVQKVDGYKFEYFEKPLEDLYLTLDNEFETQNNALLSMIGKGILIYNVGEEAEKLQNAVLEKHSRPIPPVNSEIAKELVCIINTRVDRLEKLLTKDRFFFKFYCGVVLEKILLFYHRLLGCPVIPYEKSLDIYNDSEYRKAFCYEPIPEEKFIELYKNVIYSDSLEETMYYIRGLFDYARRNVDVDPENYRIQILSRNDPKNLNHK